MKLKSELVLVTGAGGFIGSHLTDYLVAQGARVRVLLRYNSRADWGHLEALSASVRSELDVHFIDITDQSSVRQALKGCACVFHLAALIGIPYSYVAPSHYLDVNVRGTLNVLEAVKEFEIPRLVHTSTSETYGTANYTPIDERHPLQAQSPYAASKIAADKLAESYWSAFNLPVSTIRPFNTFGPRQSARAIIPTVVSQLKRNGCVRIGNLTPIRDFTYVEDTVMAFIAVAESDASVGTVLNAGNGKGITIGRLAQLLVDMIRPGAEIISEPLRVRPEKSEVMALIADSRRIKEVTGWSPRIPLSEGLARTIDYIERNPADYRRLGYVI